MHPLQCYKCGRFIGKDGKPDVSYDDYAGGWEVGYPECGRCLRESKGKIMTNTDLIAKLKDLVAEWRREASKHQKRWIPATGTPPSIRVGKSLDRCADALEHIIRDAKSDKCA